MLTSPEGTTGTKDDDDFLPYLESSKTVGIPSANQRYPIYYLDDVSHVSNGHDVSNWLCKPWPSYNT